MSLLASFIACSTDSSTTSRKDGGTRNHSTTTGGTSNGGTSNGGASNSGASSSGAPSAGAANGGAFQGGSSNAGAANGGAANAGATNSAGHSSASGGASSGGAKNSAGSPNDAAAPTLIDHYVTFYGWPDNDPAGNGIAYPKLHKGASGTGTFADPITFATDPTEWMPGTILYVPYLKRYVIMEDSCAECIQDWNTHKYHIDIWLDSDGSFDSQVLDCEDTLTRSKTSVEIDPPPDRPVDSIPLFDTKTGTCNPQ
ncbi:MAG TPA: hypothetical protein VHC69_20265 [Polyangiaceae bacterium]|nr:hypothetical protein [Polyangiaceae bacterium]